MNALDTAVAYTVDQDDLCCDAACRAAADSRIGAPAFVQRFYGFGVVEAFADMLPVASTTYLPRAAVLVWTATEYVLVNRLLDELAAL